MVSQAFHESGVCATFVQHVRCMRISSSPWPCLAVPSYVYVCGFDVPSMRRFSAPLCTSTTDFPLKNFLGSLYEDVVDCAGRLPGHDVCPLRLRLVRVSGTFQQICSMYIRLLYSLPVERSSPQGPNCSPSAQSVAHEVFSTGKLGTIDCLM